VQLSIELFVLMLLIFIFFVGDLNIPVYDNLYVHFKDVPRALVQRTLSEVTIARFFFEYRS